MRILVCGGRDFSKATKEWSFVYKELDSIRLERGFTRLIEGGAAGVDSCARAWAIYNRIPFEEYPANWEKYGKSAGYIRNSQMLEEGRPDLVVAFPGGRGTQMMVKLARDARVEVMEFKYEDN